MKPRKDTSIKDIAAKSGFSTATISRVLNHQGGYSKETENRVMNIVKELNYSIKNQNLQKIGILVPDLTNEWFAETVRCLEEELYAKNFHCYISSTNEIPSREHFCFEGLTALKVSAIISFLGSEELVSLAESASFPVLFIDRIPQTPGKFLCLESDNYIGGYMATELLIQKGCKKILFIGRNHHASVIHSRQKGYQDALKEYQLPINPELMLQLESPDHPYERSRDLVCYAIKKKIEFDGIFASSDLRASGALQALKQNGFSVPEQIKIIGFDDTSVCRQCYPALSSVRQDPLAMARHTIELLFWQLTQNPHLAKHMVLPVSIVERGTT
ncbi:hypothetical protein C806_03396 [Lachnospiraceae bacterium 3-1]|nr:hypothetical protein C806_03396 [Lachnospiraceae bacterium 3-1]